MILRILLIVAIFFFMINYAFAASSCPNFIYVNGSYNYKNIIPTRIYLKVSSVIAIKAFKDDKYYVEKHGSSLYINERSFTKLKECLK